MNLEAYCANHLKLIESEHFLAVGDHGVAEILNPSYREDLSKGKAEPLPDLLSVKKDQGKTFFRLREVKYKLEERLIEKALRQLESGVRRLRQKSKSPLIDRMEIVIPLRGRKLKPPEMCFLGEKLAPDRYALHFPASSSTPVTILLL